MNGRHETGADIAAEIRAKCRSVDGINCGIADFLALADRIERAESWLIHVEEKRRNALPQAWEPGSAAAVVRMMLDAANDLRQANPAESDDLFYFADKLLETKAVAPVNAVKMREALVEVARLDSTLKGRVLKGNKDAINLLHAVCVATSAIAAPPRNCDVGTVAEQNERYKRFCARHYQANNVDAQCDACPCGEERWDCELEWAQMPYDAAQEGAK